MAIQDKFNRPNVIYKITKDIDLGGGTLIIPEGCTLDFQGGSFSNGTIVGNGTQILKNYKLVDVELQNMLKTEFDLFSYRLKGESYSDALQRIFNNAKTYEFIDIKLDSGIYNFDKPVYITPTSNKTPYLCIYGNGFSSKVQYDGDGALINVNSGGGIGFKIYSLYANGNRSNKLIESHLDSGGAASYFQYFELYNCFINGFETGIDFKRGYSIIIDRCQFRNNTVAVRLNCANHNSITNSNFPYGNKTCIEFSDTVIPASSEDGTISTLVQGCRFEAMEIGIVLKAVWIATIMGCYFEPLSDGKTIVVNGETKRVSSLSFISNYGFYNKFMEISGNVGYISFIQNNMSMKFMDGCVVDNVYIHNYDYFNFTISGVTDDIGRNILDDSVTYNRYAPQNIQRPNLLIVPETYNGVATFDESNWTYVIADNIRCSVYFNINNIDLKSGNKYQRSFQIINADTDEVLFENAPVDPLLSPMNKPLFSIRGVDRVKLVIKCLTTSFLDKEVPYSITFSRRLYN